MRDIAGGVVTNSKAMYICGPLHMDEQRQDDQLEPVYNSSVPIQDVALMDDREGWRESVREIRVGGVIGWWNEVEIKSILQRKLCRPSAKRNVVQSTGAVEYTDCKTVVFWPSNRPKMPFQGDAPEGSDTF